MTMAEGSPAGRAGRKARAAQLDIIRAAVGHHAGLLALGLFLLFFEILKAPRAASGTGRG
jgi:hypothetical protein